MYPTARSLLTWLAISACAGAGAAPRQPAEPTVAITNVSVRDDADGPLRRDLTVVIRGRRIVSVEPAHAASIPDGALRVDGTGAVLIPGLWDMHVHLEQVSEHSMPMLVAHGVTGVRDMGSDPVLIRRWQAEASAGSRIAPRIVASGPRISGPSFRATPDRIIVSDTASARRAVDSLARLGVDFVKLHGGLTRETYLAAADRARQLGLPFSGHFPPGMSFEEAFATGAASLEHVVGGPLPCSDSLRAELRRLEDPMLSRCGSDAELAQALGALSGYQTHVTPTLASWKGIIALMSLRDGSDSLLRDPRIATIPLAHRSTWPEDTTGVPWERWPQQRARIEMFGPATGAAHRAGIRVLAGTDLGNPYVFPGSSLHDELALLVRAGLTPGEAFESATRVPTRFLGVSDSVGAIAPGMIADLVLLDGDPVDDIRNTRRIRAVVLGGRFHDRRALDAMAADARRRVSALHKEALD